MRPRRIELQGFTAFRDHTVVDFEDTDLFVFVGATGSGKSSLIDAMIFALYGSIPRYKDERLVAPAISQGKLEARVRLDFSIGDKNYSVVRVVRRTPGGATTKEARLESNGEILAGSAKELNEKVSELIGLNFSQFTSCVVLPQGEFARFLNEAPRDRQDLLVRLLGMTIYERIRRRASVIGAEYKNKIDVYTEQVAGLDSITPELEKEHKSKLSGLKKSQKSYQKERKSINAKTKESARLQETIGDATRLVKVISKLKLPGKVDELATIRSDGEAKVVAAEQALAVLARDIELAETQIESLGNLADLVALKGRQQQREETANSHKSLAARREPLTDAHLTAQTQLELAKKNFSSAQTAMEQAMLAEHVHALKADLHIGDDCPVCGQEIKKLPTKEAGARVTTAEKQLAAAKKDEANASKKATEAMSALAVWESDFNATAEKLKQFNEELWREPGAEAVAASISTIQAAETELKTLRAGLTKQTKAHKSARDELDSLATAEQKLWGDLEGVRDQLSSLVPKKIDRTDLRSAWEHFLAWAQGQQVAQETLIKEHEQKIETLNQDIDNLLAAFEAEIDALGFEVDEYDELNEVYVALITEAEAELKQIESALATKRSLVEKIKETGASKQTADALAGHLKSDRFEKWVLDTAFSQLVAGASTLLNELSSGQYSFAYNTRLEFEVIDHANADERRSAKTLSGGETFLASLALALTLADQVAGFAVKGAARLESMFLDEGFGSLDPDMLDIVASAIEELGTRGKMIGLVTHVANLADRVPVQYRVTKGPASASVERISL